jgi:hypothetical protein
MKLTFDDNSTLKAWTEKYSNITELRGYVSHKLNGKFHLLPERKPTTTNNVFIEKKYSGNSFTSFNTLLIVGMAIFFLIIINVEMKRKVPIIFPILIMSLLYIGFGIQMYFFEIKEQKLLIRNHYFPWIKTEYDLNNIEEVSKESPYRRSDGLRIITYEFKSKFFGAGSLRTGNWKELFEDLTALGIKTNN